MTRYRNPKIEAEMNADEVEKEIEEVLARPAETVEDETFKKRYGDLRRHMQEKEAERQRELEELKRQLHAAQTGQIRMPASEDEVEEWSKQYPEFRSRLDTIISKEVKKAVGTLQGELSRLKERDEEVEKEKAFLALKKRHPDVEDLFKKNSDFHKWLSAQSERDQAAIYRSLDVDDASFVIEKYKLQAKKSPSKVEDDRPAAARVVRTASEPTIPSSIGDYEFSESMIENMSTREYEANETKIMDAIRKGKFLYDLSGGAR